MRLTRLVSAAILSAAVSSVALADEPSNVTSQNQANRLAIFHDYGISAIGSTAANMPGDSGGGIISPFMGHYASTEPVKTFRPWYISATPVVGYDDNPEASQAQTSSIFAGFDLAAGYGWQSQEAYPILGPLWSANVTYDLQGAVYEGNVKQANVLQQNVRAEAQRHFLDEGIVASGYLGDSYTNYHGYSFANSLDLGGAVEGFVLPQLSAELGYDYSHLQYFYSTTAPQDPDTERNFLSAALHFYTLPQVTGAIPEAPDRFTEILRETFNRATLRFGHLWNKSDGQDYSMESNRLTFGLEGVHPLNVRDVYFDFLYGHEWQVYQHPNSIAPPSLTKQPNARRSDHLDIITLRANARLFDLPKGRGTMLAFLQYDMIHDWSNIAVRNFDENIVSVGVTYRY